MTTIFKSLRQHLNLSGLKKAGKSKFFCESDPCVNQFANSVLIGHVPNLGADFKFLLYYRQFKTL